jgi:putative ABC transport system ATP-binding protein
MSVIEVEDLVKRYGSGEAVVEALRGVSFTVDKGEFLAIMGPSGSGKSTLMNILGCLDSPTEGHYYLEGRDVSKESERELAYIRNQKLGFVFQSYNLLPRFTALHNVEQPMIYKGIRKKKRKERAAQLLKDVGLGDRLEHTPTELSGGQSQRVAIARALVNEPKIILADEPTGNLDTESEKGILDIMHRLNDRGITIIMVTHEPPLAQHADRVLHFKDGKLLRTEFPAENENGDKR